MISNQRYVSFRLIGDGKIEASDLETGKHYLAGSLPKGGRRLLLDSFGAEEEKKEHSINSISLGHWVERGWEACVAPYLLSRHINYFDAGKNRDQFIEGFYSNCEAQEVCPEIKEPKAIGENLQFDLQAIGSCTSAWLPNFYDDVNKRCSIRRFKEKPVDAKEICSVFSHTFAKVFETIDVKESISSHLSYTKNFGSAFSYYLVVYNVEDMPQGIYYISMVRRKIFLVRKVSLKEEMKKVLWGMSAPITANYTLVMCVTPDVYAWRYRHDRAMRNLFVEAGRIMQMHINSALSLNIQGVVTPATRDEILSKILDLDADRTMPFYTATMGSI